MQDSAQFDQKIVAASFGRKRKGHAARQTDTFGRYLEPVQKFFDRWRARFAWVSSGELRRSWKRHAKKTETLDDGGLSIGRWRGVAGRLLGCN
jgi:hypothetical protein